MLTEVTRGRVLRGRYAAVTDVSSGLSVGLGVRTARHCRYRSRGLTIALPSGAPQASLQSLQVSSGVRVLPERVDSSTLVPEGVSACHFSAPQVAKVCASRTSDRYVPRSDRTRESRCSLPGFDVAYTSWPARSRPSAVTCWAFARAISVGR